MTIVLIRVDDRLIHGQVLMGWTQSLGVDHIVVADDKTAADPLQTSLMSMAAPVGVQVSVLRVEDAAQTLTSGQDSSRALVLVRGPHELLRLRQGGVRFDAANVGNVHAGPDRARLTKEVHASDDELDAWRALARDGVRLEAQWLPGQPRVDLGKLVLSR